MGLLKVAFYVVVIAVALTLFKKPTLPIRTEGTVNSKFKAVQEAFR